MWQHVAAAPAWSTHYIYFTGDGSQGVLHATGVGGGSMRENQLEVELKKIILVFRSPRKTLEFMVALIDPIYF